MSEFGGLWKHENNQHALVPPKTERGCPSGGGMKNGHIRYCSYGGTPKERKKEVTCFEPCYLHQLHLLVVLVLLHTLDHLLGAGGAVHVLALPRALEGVVALLQTLLAPVVVTLLSARTYTHNDNDSGSSPDISGTGSCHMSARTHTMMTAALLQTLLAPVAVTCLHAHTQR